jgi:septin family protein
VLGMFSEALRILNHNTAVLMVDEYRKKYQEMENNLKKEMKKSQEMQQEMQEMQSNLNKEMQEQQKILDDKDKQINSQEEQHKKDLERIAELEAMLKESRESKESNGQG